VVVTDSNDVHPEEPTMRVLSGLILCGLLAAATARPGFAAENPRPNFLLFIADDVSPEDLGCYGNAGVRTPNIDRLAKDGMRCDAAFLTCSSCSPSRASILTGRYPHSTGAPELHQPLPADQIVFAGLLRQAGYYTAAAGKWHLGKPAEKHFHLVTAGGESGCDNWLKVLRERPKDRPFFLWYASNDAHRPYKPNAIPRPTAPADVIVPPYLPDVPETRRDLALYYDEITRLDGYIGDVLKELQTQGVAQNTLVLFLADNGRPFPRCKTTLYDSGIRTPFVVRWPGKVQPGTVCKQLISSIDIAPALVELAGLKSPSSFQGTSFARLFSQPDQPIREYIFAEHNWHDYQAHERAVRTKDFLYIRNSLPNLPATPPADAVRSITFQAMLKLEQAGKLKPQQRGCFVKPRPAEELYDVRKDPDCLNDLAADPAHADQVRQLRRVLDEWIKTTHDRVPEKPRPDEFDRTTGQKLQGK
jgi:N-sulfoglucosamine sulfohydrolase